MKIGLSYDLKESVTSREGDVTDALEEYDSAETIETIAAALRHHGHEVIMLGGGKEFISAILANDPDIVFNIAEGRGNYRSRESQVPAILEMLDIPYTGSDPQTLSVCLDKPLTKKLVALESNATPAWDMVHDETGISAIDWSRYDFPVIIKPAFEGSSKGIHVSALVDDAVQARNELVSQLRGYKQPVLIEQFVDGAEITVGVIGNTDPRILGIMQVVPRQQTEHFVYSLEVKRDWKHLVDYQCPAHFETETTKAIEEASLRIYRILGCRDFARIDFRVDRSGKPQFIEINPLPGLGSYSDLIIMGQLLGETHRSIIYSVFEAALERYPRLS